MHPWKDTLLRRFYAMGKQKLDGLGKWPRTTGRHLEGNTTVLCTQLGLGPQVPDTSVGYVRSSHQVGGVWKYEVAIPPFSFPGLLEKWCLVGGVHPSQLTPVSLLVPETLHCVSSPARILDENYNLKLPMVKAPKTDIGSTVAAKRPVCLVNWAPDAPFKKVIFFTSVIFVNATNINNIPMTFFIIMKVI
jgi:hypothetical protein